MAVMLVKLSVFPSMFGNFSNCSNFWSIKQKQEEQKSTIYAFDLKCELCGNIYGSFVEE